MPTETQRFMREVPASVEVEATASRIVRTTKDRTIHAVCDTVRFEFFLTLTPDYSPVVLADAIWQMGQWGLEAADDDLGGSESFLDAEGQRITKIWFFPTDFDPFEEGDELEMQRKLLAYQTKTAECASLSVLLYEVYG